MTFHEAQVRWCRGNGKSLFIGVVEWNHNEGVDPWGDLEYFMDYADDLAVIYKASTEAAE